MRCDQREPSQRHRYALPSALPHLCQGDDPCLLNAHRLNSCSTAARSSRTEMVCLASSPSRSASGHRAKCPNRAEYRPQLVSSRCTPELASEWVRTSPLASQAQPYTDSSDSPSVSGRGSDSLRPLVACDLGAPGLPPTLLSWHASVATLLRDPCCRHRRRDPGHPGTPGAIAGALDLASQELQS